VCINSFLASFSFELLHIIRLIKLITPWTSTLSDGKRDVLPQINALLWSELWLVPLLRLLDLWGNVQKHILAPRCRTQEQMNLNFQGTKVGRLLVGAVNEMTAIWSHTIRSNFPVIRYLYSIIWGSGTLI